MLFYSKCNFVVTSKCLQKLDSKKCANIYRSYLTVCKRKINVRDRTQLMLWLVGKGQFNLICSYLLFLQMCNKSLLSFVIVILQFFSKIQFKGLCRNDASNGDGLNGLYGSDTCFLCSWTDNRKQIYANQCAQADEWNNWSSALGFSMISHSDTCPITMHRLVMKLSNVELRSRLHDKQ